MALWEFTNTNRYNNYRTTLLYSKGPLSISPKFGPVQMVNRFKYKHTHPLHPPMLFVSKGKKYLMPHWIEVHPQTELTDIEWVKPKIKVKTKPEVTKHQFESSSSDKIYTVSEYTNEDGTKKYSCNCPGVWRSKERKCKHIKSVEK